MEPGTDHDILIQTRRRRESASAEKGGDHEVFSPGSLRNGLLAGLAPGLRGSNRALERQWRGAPDRSRLPTAEAAKENAADLVIVGTHARTGAARFFLGSVASRVIAIAPCPVLTVRVA